MVTNAQLVLYINQIANLFCSNDLLCKTNITSRLKTIFNNDTLLLFLSRIDVGRSYQVYFDNYRVNENNSRRYVDFYLKDVITGETEKLTWNWLTSGNFYEQLKNGLQGFNYEILQGAPIFDSLNWKQKRIVYNSNKPNYGLTFIQSNIPTPTPSGGTGNIPTPTGGNIIPTPNAPINSGAPVEAGFDFWTLLQNPIVWLAVGGAVYWKLIKR